MELKKVAIASGSLRKEMDTLISLQYRLSRGNMKRKLSELNELGEFLKDHNL